MAHEATIRGVGVGVGAGGVGAPAVILEARDEVVPIFVDPGQAQTIEHGRQGIPAERPLTHDLFADVLADLDGELERVRIDALEADTFYAKLDLTVERGDTQKTIVRDARPSDGIALAVRVDCPITVVDDVIDEAGQDPDQFLHEPDELGGPAGAGPDVGRGLEPTGRGDRDVGEAVDLDDAVDIEFEEADAAGDEETETDRDATDDPDDASG